MQKFPNMQMVCNYILMLHPLSVCLHSYPHPLIQMRCSPSPVATCT